MVIVGDGTADAARRLEGVPSNHPASGVMRRADAACEDAIAGALDLPGILDRS